MIENRNSGADLLASENLPLNLDDLGMVTQAELVMPGVYDAVLENPETGVGIEAYIALKKCTWTFNGCKRIRGSGPRLSRTFGVF